MAKRKLPAPELTVDCLHDKLDYDPLTGIFTWKWSSRQRRVVGQPAGWTDSTGHIVIEIQGRRYKAGRLAWFYVHGYWPVEADHRDRDPQNNRLANLRDATRRLNNVNRVRKRKHDLPRGVDMNKKGFLARLCVNGVVRCLGTYPTPQEASEVYQKAARAAYGDWLPKEL